MRGDGTCGGWSVYMPVRGRDGLQWSIVVKALFHAFEESILDSVCTIGLMIEQ